MREIPACTKITVKTAPITDRMTLKWSELRHLRVKGGVLLILSQVADVKLCDFIYCILKMGMVLVIHPPAHTPSCFDAVRISGFHVVLHEQLRTVRLTVSTKYKH